MTSKNNQGEKSPERRLVDVLEEHDFKK